MHTEVTAGGYCTAALVKWFEARPGLLWPTYQAWSHWKPLPEKQSECPTATPLPLLSIFTLSPALPSTPKKFSTLIAQCEILWTSLFFLKYICSLTSLYSTLSDISNTVKLCEHNINFNALFNWPLSLINTAPVGQFCSMSRLVSTSSTIRVLSC